MRRLTSVVLVVLMAAAQGCVSMKAVQEYADQSHKTLDCVRPVAKDYYQSCIRANSYKPFSAQKDCSLQKEASQAIILVADVLDKYVMALEALAKDDAVDYTANFDGLSGAINKTKMLDSDQVNAASKLASLVASAATDAYRQDQVVSVILQANQSVIVVANSLADLIKNQYSLLVQQELHAWSSQYQLVEKTSRNPEEIMWVFFAESQWKTKGELDAKLTAADSLAKSIKEIGSAHNKLKIDASKLTSKEVYAFVKSYVAKARPVIDEVKDAFGKE